MNQPRLKVAIGMRPYAGPWGGGNRFVSTLTEALVERGHSVSHSLDRADLDLVLLVDPRTRSPNVTFGAGEILRYLLLKNPSAVVVHRVNECDERKGERFINDRLARANYVADATVFVGEWLTRLPIWQATLRQPWFVVRNGADSRVFNSQGFRAWDGDEPLKLVTHHWGYHRFKGFDIYEALDRRLEEVEFGQRYRFTYIGNLPKGFRFSRVHHFAPLDGIELAAELRRHHVYVTGSINEPGGNHQNEGALCGLPLLYRESGCMPEYCRGSGVSFSSLEDFFSALDRLRVEYRSFVQVMGSYPHTGERMCGQWMQLMEELVVDRADLVARRRLLRNPLSAMATQWPL